MRKKLQEKHTEMANEEIYKKYAFLTAGEILLAIEGKFED